MGWKRILTTSDTEFVEDTVGAMFTGNTETGITVSYDDSANDINLTVADTTVAGDTGSTAMTPGDTLTIAGGTGVTTAMSGDTLTVTASTQLSTENVEDIVGGMLDGTETGISVSYDDDGGANIDFVVSDTTVAGDSGSTGMTPGDTLTIAGGTNVTTAMSGDTLTITATDASAATTFQVEDDSGDEVTISHAKEWAILGGTGIGTNWTDTSTGSDGDPYDLTITNDGVTSNVAGSGISVSGATGAVTVTNSGVTSNVAGTGISVSGATGAVTVTNSGVTSAVAGSGISVSGATGAVTVTNSGVTALSATANETTVSGSTGSISIGLPDDVTIGGVLTVTGNLVVNGTTTTVSSTNLSVEDVCISLNTNSDGDDWAGSLSAGDSAILFAGLSASPAVDETIKLVCDFDGFQFDTGDARACLAVTHANSTTFGTSNSITQGTLAHVKAAAYVYDDTQGTLIYDSGNGVPTDGTIVAAADELYIYFA
jgi:hypothetical protein